MDVPGASDRRRRQNIADFIPVLWGAADVRAYLRDRGSEEDYWDYYADLQMLRRHHVTCRTELFGHDPRDPGWSSCGKSREDFTGLRRTMILQHLQHNGYIMCVVDSFQFPDPMDQLRPRICDGGWWGFTDFQLQGGFDISRPPPRGHVEDPEADGDGEDSADRTESEEGGYEEAGESSTAEPDSQEQSPPQEIPSPDQAWMTIGDKAEEKGQEGASQLHEMRLRGQDLDRPLEFPRSGVQQPKKQLWRRQLRLLLNLWQHMKTWRSWRRTLRVREKS